MTAARRGGEWLCLLAVMAGAFVLLRSGAYGWTLFACVPMLIGALAAWLVRPASGASAAAIGALANLLAAVLVLVFAVEGLGCLVMALPLTVPMGALGGWLGYTVRWKTAPARVAMCLVLPPAGMALDRAAPPPVYEVRSHIEIAAPPEQVWRQVVRFSDIPEPREWLFRIGIAYPQRARIVGSGSRAVRYCEFSTGPFVEPIEVWDEPRLLRFRVTANPAPMHEWSPYRGVEPKHLHGYLISRRGQFQLTHLTNGRTLLEGTTWYQHGLWPAEYWRWWSDAIIHRIHMRVLDHIRVLSEIPAAQ